MDEMDLVRQLKGVPPLRPEAYERARATLGTAMARSGAVRKPNAAEARKRFFLARNSRVGLLGKVGMGAVAAAVAVVAVISSTLQPQAPVVDSRLVALAADVEASAGSLPGDASLVVRSTTASDGTPYVTYNLYTDKGEVYVTDTRSTLAEAIASQHDLAEPTDSRLVAAAREAATGDLGKARVRMVNATPNAWGLGLSPAEAQQVWDEAEARTVQMLEEEKGVANPTPRPRPTGEALEDGINNSLWTNSLDALTIGAANPRVRAGVLRLIATIPEVTVVNSVTDGEPTLTLTAGPALFQGDGEHVLTINADTGLPIRSETKPVPGQQDPVPPAVATYESARVTVADIVAGRF